MVAKEQHQWQHPDNRQGAYYSDKGVPPEKLGTAPCANHPDNPEVVAKDQRTYKVKDGENPPYLESTSAPVQDNWSVKDNSKPDKPGVPISTEGGGTQRLVPDRDAFTLVNNGS